MSTGQREFQPAAQTRAVNGRYCWHRQPFNTGKQILPPRDHGFHFVPGLQVGDLLHVGTSEEPGRLRAAENDGLRFRSLQFRDDIFQLFDHRTVEHIHRTVGNIDPNGDDAVQFFHSKMIRDFADHDVAPCFS